MIYFIITLYTYNSWVRIHSIEQLNSAYNNIFWKLWWFIAFYFYLIWYNTILYTVCRSTCYDGRLDVKRLSAHANGQAMNAIRCVIHLSWNGILFLEVKRSCYSVTTCLLLLNNRKYRTLHTHKIFCISKENSVEGLEMGIFHFFVREALPVILFARFETSGRSLLASLQL